MIGCSCDAAHTCSFSSFSQFLELAYHFVTYDCKLVLIRQERAREQGELVEQQSLPVLQEVVRKEVRQALAEHRKNVRDDRAEEMEEQNTFLRKGFDRIAALTVNAIRNAGIGRRLSYSLLAKAYGSTFALEAFEDAKEKAKRELLPKRKEEDEG